MRTFCGEGQGKGDIAGVATAISAGGTGAIFWMWILGVLGMGTKFFEVAPGIQYTTREPVGLEMACIPICTPRCADGIRDLKHGTVEFRSRRTELLSCPP